jgi:hypothetical protein
MPTSGDPVGVLETALLDPPVSAGIPVTLPQLRRDVATAQSVFQEGRYTEVVTALPGLLSAATTTRAALGSVEDVAGANGQLSELYMLASELMVRLGNDHLAWITADCAQQTAYGSGDVLTQATARRVWAIVLRRAGRADTAQRLVVDAAAALQSDLHRGPDYLSVYGSLLSTAAYTAIEAARHINPATIPLADQRARYWSNIARSFHQWGKPEQCYRALLAAEHASPDEVRYHKPIQQITTGLLRLPAARTMPGLRAFARRTGAPV